MAVADLEQSNIDSQTIEDASRFLSKVLRHEPDEYGISLSPSGWAELADVKMALRSEFDENPVDILRKVRDADDENRFQFVLEKLFKGVRATRGHTTDEVEILELTPDESELSWYLMEFENSSSQSLYVEADSEESAERVVERRLEYDVEDAKLTELDKKITWSQDPQKSGSDSLAGNTPPHILVHQSADKYLSVEKRVNQAGDKGRYVKVQPKDVRSRLPNAE